MSIILDWRIGYGSKMSVGLGMGSDDCTGVETGRPDLQRMEAL
jgi:hypothetical protein